MSALTDEQKARIESSRAKAAAARLAAGKRASLASRMEAAKNRTLAPPSYRPPSDSRAPAGFIPAPARPPKPAAAQPARPEEAAADPQLISSGRALPPPPAYSEGLISQSRALDRYLLPPSALSGLDWVERENPAGHERKPIKLYEEALVKERGVARWGSLEGIEEERARREEERVDLRKRRITGEQQGKKARKKGGKTEMAGVSDSK
ncbi:hypothetical protein TeGR_g7527 [Tetraparma gracilis]|uniref:Uncharacterized protein n=1 Tax=Tetraparma gracilis TaxID=2962635 RepID=A0ABQ6MFY9_9STRA|nr:hypothetical protein TeGR_g7527 [Tetraparma gracilis]